MGKGYRALGEVMQTNYLVGPRVKLLKFTDRHITHPYINWLNDSKVNRFLHTGRLPISKDELYAPEGDSDLLFAMMSNLIKDDSGRLIKSNEYQNYIGTVSLHDIDWISRNGKVGYMIGDSNHWNIGIATEVVGLVTDYAFNRLNLNKIVAGVVDGNTGSEKVLLKNGYKKYCTEPQEYYLEGKYLDTDRFYKLQEWHK